MRWQNWLLQAKLHFVQKKIHFVQTKLHFVQTILDFVDGIFILLWILQFCRRNCILLTELYFVNGIVFCRRNCILSSELNFVFYNFVPLTPTIELFWNVCLYILLIYVRKNYQCLFNIIHYVKLYFVSEINYIYLPVCNDYTSAKPQMSWAIID